MNIDLEKLKSLIVEICIQVLQDNELKQLVEKVQSADELINILNNHSLPLSGKQIKTYKLLVKKKIEENPNYGPVTKNVFKNIIDSDITPKEMVKKYFNYISIFDISC